MEPAATVFMDAVGAVPEQGTAMSCCPVTVGGAVSAVPVYIPTCRVLLIAAKWPELKPVAIQDFLTLLGIYTRPGHK